MLVKDVEEALESHPFTRGLPAAYTRLIADCGELREFMSGDYLWRQGDLNRETYLIMNGQVALEIAVPHEGKLPFEMVSAGEIAGCTGLFRSSSWGFDARAVTAVRAVVLNTKAMRAAIERDHEFGYQFLQRCANALAQRLNASRLRLIEAHKAVLP